MKAPLYRGRFAPSPSGDMHLGSLVAALASFLQARIRNGIWQVRIEDLDGPRCAPGATRRILASLAAHGLLWDGDPILQSRRLDTYRDALRWLLKRNRAYWCGCTRRQALTGPMGIEGAIYCGRCRNGLAPGCEPRLVRLRTDGEILHFTDLVQGACEQNVGREVGDFVIRRGDGIYAYQLAVVVDDAADGVTEVVRGADLLGSTARQILLQRRLNLPCPGYCHVPLVKLADGRKLSKQHGAPPLRSDAVSGQLRQALVLLGQQPPAEATRWSPTTVLDWAMTNWCPATVPRGLSPAISHATAGASRHS